MKRLLKNQSGIAAIIWLILLLIILLILFWILWQAWGKKQAANNSKQTETAKEEVAKDTQEDKYFTVQELGVKFKVNDNLADLSYYYKLAVDGKYAYFTSVALLKSDPNCSAEFGPLGAFGRYDGNFDAEQDVNSSLLKQFDSFYITYAEPQAYCSDKDAVNNQAAQTRGLLKEAIKTVQLVN